MDKKQSMDVAACPVNASHETTACVPVKIKPFANPGKVSMECCGCPTIKMGDDDCSGTLNGCCEFTVSQKMKIDIPITFGADISVGETYVKCGKTEGSADGDGCICSCAEPDDEYVYRKEYKDKKDCKDYKDYTDISRQFM